MPTKERVNANQKIYDDIKAENKDLDVISNSFGSIKTIYEKNRGKAGSLASADQAMVTLFNKMLDPGSVVREGEYDRSAQGQALLERAQAYVDKIQQGGAGITDEARADMVDIARQLYSQALKGYAIRKENMVERSTALGSKREDVEKLYGKEPNPANFTRYYSDNTAIEFDGKGNYRYFGKDKKWSEWTPEGTPLPKKGTGTDTLGIR